LTSDTHWQEAGIKAPKAASVVMNAVLANVVLVKTAFMNKVS